MIDPDKQSDETFSGAPAAVPTEGGSYVVRPDGSLERTQATRQLPPVPAPGDTQSEEN